MDDDTISRKAAVNALWKALYEYEDKTEKRFQESEDLDIYDWMVHRIFVQNMSDIDRRTILDLPSAERQKVQSNECEYWDNESNFCSLYRPSAERRGRWIPDFGGKFKGGAYWFRCSRCGRVVPNVRNGGWNYCPDCGARMEAKE